VIWFFTRRDTTPAYSVSNRTAKGPSLGFLSHAHEVNARTVLSALTYFFSLNLVMLPLAGICTDIIAAPPNFPNQNATIPLSLDDAVLLGMRNNRNVQAAYLQRITQKFNLYVSEGKFFPKLTIAGSFNKNSADGIATKTKALTTTASMNLPTGAALSLASTNSGTVGSASSSVKVLTLTQPLLKNGGIEANMASVRMARIDEQINQLNLKATLSQTVTQIIYAYRELLRAQEQKKIAEAALQRGRELYEVNKLLISTGRMAEVEIIQTEAEVANQEVAVEEAKNQIDASRLALLTLLALEPATAVDASGFDAITAKVPDIDQALAAALENQPDYLISLLSVDRAKINLDFARNQQLWDVSLVAGKTRAQGGAAAIAPLSGGTATLPPDSTSSYVGVQVAIPLGDRSIPQVAVQASVDLKNQNLRAQDMHQTLEQRVRDAVRNVQTRWRQLELSKKARDLTLRKLEAEKEKLTVGRSSNFQILTFEGDLRNAENAQLNAQIAYLNALTDFDDKTGRTLDTWKIPIIELDSLAYEF